MSFYRDKQIMGYMIFLTVVSVLAFISGLLFCIKLTAAAESIYLTRDAVIVSSLLEQGVPQNVIAAALNNSVISDAGEKLLSMLGRTKQTVHCSSLPLIIEFRREIFLIIILTAYVFSLLLFAGSFVFFGKRRRLYSQIEDAISSYMDGDFSKHLPQNREGAIFHIFSRVEQLAAMLEAKSESEHKTKEFLKGMISDISHQLKTPLAALAMYQEIIESESDNAGTVRKFSVKTGAALRRMEGLIQSLLKITRLDTGSIVFEKHSYDVSEIILRSVNELTVRAVAEGKEIRIAGGPVQKLVCDMEWTSEAIGNIVKNALDHTQSGEIVCISWERSPAMLRIFISDDGSGIAPEDIHHIFKRFYRSRHSLDTQGVGLGLSLAKSIVEGQGGIISVQSGLNEGTTFILSFLTEL